MHEPAEYRSVSPLAIAAAIVGGCSAVALMTPLAWMVPLIGIGLSAAALADIAGSGGTKAGRPLALVGLALAVGFGSQAVTGSLVETWILGHRARATATIWADAVRSGRMADALAASGPGFTAPPGGPSPGSVDSDEARLARFTAAAGVADVQACGAATPTIVDADPLGTDDGAWVVRLSLGPCGSDRVLRLTVAPSATAGAGTLLERWLVRRAEFEP